MLSEGKLFMNHELVLTCEYLTVLEESPQICRDRWCLLFQELTVLFAEGITMDWCCCTHIRHGKSWDLFNYVLQRGVRFAIIKLDR